MSGTTSVSNPLLKKLLKGKGSSLVSKSEFFNLTDDSFVKTAYPAMNIILSGSPNRGLSPGFTVIAGPSRHFKSLLGLAVVSAYLNKHKDGVCLFYDTEFGITEEYMKAQGVDVSRVVHIPVESVEKMKIDIAQKLEELVKGDKVIIFVDSFGNMGSDKEAQDALDGKTVGDMTRAKALKSLFRIITAKLTIKDIPCVGIAHTYQEIGLFPKTIIGGGCLTAGHKVLTEGGACSIENIVVGDKVMTHDGTYQLVTHTWNKHTLLEPKPDLYEVEMENGVKFKCSANHKLLTTDNKWVGVTDYNNEDILADLKIKNIKKIDKEDVYDLTVENNNSYRDVNGINHHNTGLMFAANTAIIITKAMEKEGKELKGFTFNLNVEKSRFVKEKARIGLKVLFDSGIDKYSGLLDLALESKHIISPTNGWYALPASPDSKVRKKDTDIWLEDLLNNKEFVAYIENKYKLGSESTGKVSSDEEE